jgi:hypothetical protein
MLIGIRSQSCVQRLDSGVANRNFGVDNRVDDQCPVFSVPRSAYSASAQPDHPLGSRSLVARSSRTLLSTSTPRQAFSRARRSVRAGIICVGCVYGFRLVTCPLLVIRVVILTLVTVTPECGLIRLDHCDRLPRTTQRRGGPSTCVAQVAANQQVVDLTTKVPASISSWRFFTFAQFLRIFNANPVRHQLSMADSSSERMFPNSRAGQPSGSSAKHAYGSSGMRRMRKSHARSKKDETGRKNGLPHPN